MTQDWKDKLGSMFNIDSLNVEIEPKQNEELDKTIAPNKQTLYVTLDKKGRKGKSATIITGFEISDNKIDELAAELKKKCGVGGSSRGGEILIQGDFVAKIIDLLKSDGYKVKRIGG